MQANAFKPPVKTSDSRYFKKIRNPMKEVVILQNRGKLLPDSVLPTITQTTDTIVNPCFSLYKEKIRW